ncbi:phenylacetate--CoA ligase family protein [Gilvimarinus sp. F26214L]|uniref:phenylacetate--CoA ligase family protein n=1 Tax=Gilvimarinus sp. DZF01 TaxID=3461371 RepID=UPI0040465630
MNRYISRYLCYYPATLLKGERIGPALKRSRQFQWLDQKRIRDYQIERVRDIVRWAKEKSPFYSDLYRQVNPDRILTLEDMATLPSISKTDLILNQGRMVTQIGGKCETKTTGGSTGHPVRVVKNANALAMERAVTWRAYEWAGVSVGDPQGRFWGVPHTRKARAKAWLTDLVANRKRLSAFNLNDQSMADYYRELQAFRPRYLYGYVSVIEALARFIRDQGLGPIVGIKSIITTSEILYPKSRAVIEAAFQVSVFNEYGCGEVGSVAHECEDGRLHLMADNLFVEVDGDREGELLVTDFFNYKTPLIRYRVGDYGRLSDSACSCGRGLPVLDKVYGRAYDLLTLENGTSIHPESLIYVVEDFKSERDVITQFQAIQRSHRQVDIYVVPNSAWTEDCAGQLVQRMKAKLSAAMDYRVELVAGIEREKSGKMRLVKSEVAA